MRTTFIFLAVFSTTTLMGETPIGYPMVLESGKTSITIPQRGAEGPTDWRSLSCKGGCDIQVLHAAIRRGDTLYILFTLAGWSRGAPSDRGRCGSGWERQINWMEIKGGVVTSHQQRDIESCWSDAVGSIDGWKSSSLFWTTDERDGSYECYFDSLKPEKGIQIKSFTPYKTDKAEQGGADQPATAPQSMPSDESTPNPELKARPQ